MPLSRPITSLELWPIRPFPSPDFIEDGSIRISSANLNSTWLIVFYESCQSPVSVTSSSVTCLRYCIRLRSLTGAAINPREYREHANERRCLRTQYGRRTVWPLELPSPAMTWRGGHQLWKLLWPWWTWQSSCSSVTTWITWQSVQCCPEPGVFETAWTLTGSPRHSNCATLFFMIAVTRTLVWHIGLMMGSGISRSVYGHVMESIPTLTLGENCTKIPCAG